LTVFIVFSEKCGELKSRVILGFKELRKDKKLNLKKKEFLQKNWSISRNKKSQLMLSLSKHESN